MKDFFFLLSFNGEITGKVDHVCTAEEIAKKQPGKTEDPQLTDSQGKGKMLWK